MHSGKIDIRNPFCYGEHCLYINILHITAHNIIQEALASKELFTYNKFTNGRTLRAKCINLLNVCLPKLLSGPYANMASDRESLVWTIPDAVSRAVNKLNKTESIGRTKSLIIIFYPLKIIFKYCSCYWYVDNNPLQRCSSRAVSIHRLLFEFFIYFDVFL